MTSVALDPYQKLKHQAALTMILIAGVMATMAILLHSLQPDAHVIDKVAPSVFLMGCVVHLAYFYRRSPTDERLLSRLALFTALPFLIPNWFFTINAFLSPETTLIDHYPPLSSALFIWTTVTLIFIVPHHRIKFIVFGWLVGAAPVLGYLALHPVELKQLRGLDLFFSLGPAMLIQSITVLFYSRLQVLVETLSAERLQYYAKVIETQAIRQQAMEQAFTQFHNGPLQSLAVLLQDVQTQEVPSPELLQRLGQLNAEIRDVGQSLIQSTQAEDTATPLAKTPLPQPPLPQAPIVASTVRLGSGKHLELSLPLHNLLYEVYATTLSRDLPHFQTIQIKVRNFAPLDVFNTTAPVPHALTFDVKRDICLWFEEALCNVGKHAEGVTRLQVSGTCEDSQYCVRVQDNGRGLQASQAHQGTQQSHVLAQRLGGTFRRESLAKGGVVCELSWPLDIKVR